MNQWRDIQRENFTSLEKLSSFLQFDDRNLELLAKATSFPLNVPRRFAEKMAKNRLDDPLFRQFVPLDLENESTPGFTKDPVSDVTFRKKAKLLQKYQGRALLLVTSACVMNCRFCFRRSFEYATTSRFDAELEAIKRDTTLEEIILSGGDPLSLSNGSLHHLIEELGKISHVKRLRFHTRFPLGIPERIDDEFLTIIKETALQTWFIIHTNHANEWDDDTFFALKKIQKLGIPLLSQTVLLKGVNDTTEALFNLFQLLVNQGVMPYYLHQLDRVEGGHHFEVSIEEGQELMRSLQRVLSGYALPRYVQEIPNEKHKTILF